MTIDHLKHMEIDLFIFPETNLDTRKPIIRKQVDGSLRKPLGQGTYNIEMTTSNAKYTGQYKPGGVMRGIIGKHRGRTIETGHDKYG